MVLGWADEVQNLICLPTSALWPQKLGNSAFLGKFWIGSISKSETGDVLRLVTLPICLDSEVDRRCRLVCRISSDLSRYCTSAPAQVQRRGLWEISSGSVLILKRPGYSLERPGRHVFR